MEDRLQEESSQATTCYSGFSQATLLKAGTVDACLGPWPCVPGFLSGRRIQLRTVSPLRPRQKCCINPNNTSQGLFSQGPCPPNSWNAWLMGVSPQGSGSAGLIHPAGGLGCSLMGCGLSHCLLRLGASWWGSGPEMGGALSPLWGHLVPLT